MEQGRSGGSTGGPVAREIFLEYFSDIMNSSEVNDGN